MEFMLATRQKKKKNISKKINLTIKNNCLIMKTRILGIEEKKNMEDDMII
jgi:hypothetical protein